MTPNASWDQCKALAEKHTPGPWAVQTHHPDYIVPQAHTERKCGFAVDDAVDLREFAQTIASVQFGKRHRTAEEVAANARLIAAAPELLEALEEVLRWDARRGYLLPYSVRDPARAAVAKARGQS